MQLTLVVPLAYLFTLVRPSVTSLGRGQHVAPEILVAHTAWVKGSKEVAGLMISFSALKAEAGVYRLSHDFHAVNRKKGSQLACMFLRMKGYIDLSSEFGAPVTLALLFGSSDFFIV
ncbi:hypothetical protein Tco_0315655 [Tanacetum coccineum]